MHLLFTFFCDWRKGGRGWVVGGGPCASSAMCVMRKRRAGGEIARRAGRQMSVCVRPRVCVKGGGCSGGNECEDTVKQQWLFSFSFSFWAAGYLVCVG